MEQVIGTVAGGVTGYIVYLLNTRLSEGADELSEILPTSLVIGLTAGSVGCIGAWCGHKLKLLASARLFTISFILVFSGSATKVLCLFFNLSMAGFIQFHYAHMTPASFLLNSPF